MEDTNKKISAFQLGTIGVFIGNALLIGFGVTGMLTFAKNDAWMTPLLSLIIGLIPVGIILYLANYHPDKHIFQKNTILFGKILGNIINVILCLYVLFILLVITWTTTNFAVTIYLSNTPNTIIGILFVIAALYAISKGIETIGRTSQIIFYIALFMMSTIIISLWPLSQMDNVKPVLIDGFAPIIQSSFMFLSFCLTPYLLFLIIPKKQVINTKYYNLGILGGFIYSMLYMATNYYLINSVLTNPLASLYRYPAYYVQRKISIGGVIDNVENFLSLHWFFNAAILIIMGFYFLKIFLTDTVKIKKRKPLNIIIVIIAGIVVYLPNFMFRNTVIALEFMSSYFHILVSLVLFIYLLVAFIIAFLKKNKHS